MDVKLEKRTWRKLVIAGLVILGIYLLLKETERVSAVLGFIYRLISPFLIGGCIAFVLTVPLRAVERHLRFIKNEVARRTIAIALTLILLLVLVAVLVLMLVPQIRMTIDQLSRQLPAFFDDVNETLLTWLDRWPPLRGILGIENIDEGIDWMKLVEKMLNAFETNFSGLFGGAVTVIGDVLSALYTGIISLIFACYCMARKETLARQGRKLLYSIVREKSADEIVRVLRMSNSVFSNFITGQCLDAVILGLMCALAMVILGMPYIPLISVIIIVTALVPVLGALVGGALGALLILVSSPIKAVIFVIMFIVVQQIDNNVCYPKVVGESIGLPGMWVLVAVMVGEGLMGVAGMLLMVPFASVLYTLLREFTAKRVEKRNIAPEKLQCQPPELQQHFLFRKKEAAKQRMQERKREKAKEKEEKN